MKDVVIVSACRTAIGAFGGSLRDLSAVNMAEAVIRGAIERAGINGARIDDIRFGCCFEPIDAANIARVAALKAGIPDSATAVTMNRVCCSGMEAVVSGMAMIQVGLMDIVLAGGVEHMSGVPYVLPKARWGGKLQDFACEDSLIHGLRGGSNFVPYPADGDVASYRGKPYIMGETAEFVARKFGITRQAQDEVALRSHNNAERATLDGNFADEIIPLSIPRGKKDPIVFQTDEHFRPGLKMEQLAKLQPAFMKDGTVTAGNASGMNDGAAALIIMSHDKARELGLKPLARIQAVGRAGCPPYLMGLGPILSVADLLKKSGMALNDFELIELNEAFAAQYVACERELGIDRERTNVNGSGIGLGHPVGATGARIIVSLVHALGKRHKTVGLASLCGGGGISLAMAIERLN